MGEYLMADLSTIQILQLPEDFLPKADEDYFVVQNIIDSTTFKLKLSVLADAIGTYNDAPSDGGYYIRQNGSWVKTVDYGGY
jgi:hypothetical protein